MRWAENAIIITITRGIKSERTKKEKNKILFHILYRRRVASDAEWTLNSQVAWTELRKHVEYGWKRESTRNDNNTAHSKQSTRMCCTYVAIFWMVLMVYLVWWYENKPKRMNEYFFQLLTLIPLVFIFNGISNYSSHCICVP